MTRTVDDKLKALKMVLAGIEPMTVGEAGEEILLGPFQACIACDGEGGWRIQDVYSTCDKCRGYGKIYREKFKVACYILDMPLPELGVNLFQQETIAIQIRLFREASVIQQHFITKSKIRDQAKKVMTPLPSFFPPWAKR